MTQMSRILVEVRNMTEEEMETEGWYAGDSPIVLVFKCGTKVYPSRDTEGNGAGVLFATDPEGVPFYFGDRALKGGKAE